MFRNCRNIPFFVFTGVSDVLPAVVRGVRKEMLESLSEGILSGVTDGLYRYMQYCINIQFIDCR